MRWDLKGVGKGPRFLPSPKRYPACIPYATLHLSLAGFGHFLKLCAEQAVDWDPAQTAMLTSQVLSLELGFPICKTEAEGEAAAAAGFHFNTNDKHLTNIGGPALC